MLIAEIFWNVNPEIIKLGPFSLRYYGSLFALGFVFGYIILAKIFKEEKRPESDIERVSLYVIIGSVIGARLGHCLFYNPTYYLTNPFEIIKVWEGGLASHGGAIGILIALYLLSKKMKGVSMLWILDRLVIVVALAATLIRLGNLFNSEIIGTPSNLPWAFVFARIDNVPRHPAQLYESIFYFISFIVLFFTYKKFRGKLKTGFLFGLFLILIFGFRFFVEFVKVEQADFEKGLMLDMGQFLSIPFVAAGLSFMFRKKEEIVRKQK